MLLDADGHLKLTDFGFAKQLPSGHRTYTLCGTPDYLAPEVILNKGHGKQVDWWALGILIYEMLAGYPPFVDDDPLSTYQRILQGTLTFPSYVSPLGRDLIRRLLQADLSKRIGCLAGGARDVKMHAWFRSINFLALKAKKIPAPIRYYWIKIMQRFSLLEVHVSTPARIFICYVGQQCKVLATPQISRSTAIYNR